MSNTNFDDAQSSYHTAMADGFTAIVQDHAIHPETDGLYMLSLVGSQVAVKAIWATLVKNPPGTITIVRTTPDGAHQWQSQRYVAIEPTTHGTWKSYRTRLPLSGSYHLLMYSDRAHLDRDEHRDFLLLAEAGENLADRHYAFLNRKLTLPLHPLWSQWLWRRALAEGLATRLNTLQRQAYHCTVDPENLQEDLSSALRANRLPLPEASQPEASQPDIDPSSPGVMPCPA